LGTVDDVTTLGRNVRRIRQERQLSQGALARAAGLAKQTLANLENGTGNPTVETLLAVARALGVGVNWLVTEWGSPVLVQRGETAAWADDPTGRRRTLDQIYGSGQVITTLVDLAPTEAGVLHALSSGTLHHVYVISGSVLTGPADDVQALDRGDFIRFPGDVPHVLRSSSERALVHIVTTVPQVQQFTH
jgi:transcriptional regulator with XRE-family HTH domain